MRLQEFYALDEARTRFFTLEPETNGNGRLLAWEEISYAGPGSEEAEEERSYTVVAHGGIDQLVDALRAQTDLRPESEEEVRQLFDRAIETGGEAVVFDTDGRVDITTKAGKGEEGKFDSNDYDYDEDNPDRYF